MNYPGQISEVNICKNMAYLQIRQLKVSFTSISHGLEQEMDLTTFSFDIIVYLDPSPTIEGSA